MNMQRGVVSPVPPRDAAVVDHPAGRPVLEGSLSRSITLRDRVETLEGLDKQKVAKFFRALLIAKYLRNDNVPHEIERSLYLGSIGAAFNKTLLQSLNITHILTVANAVDMPFPHQFKYLRIEVLDSVDVNLSQYFNTCFAFIDEARASGGGVLVHCFAGRSRSVTVVIAYLMRTYRLSLAQAHEHVVLRRPMAQPNPGFMRQLQNFELQLQGISLYQLGKGMQN